MISGDNIKHVKSSREKIFIEEYGMATASPEIQVNTDRLQWPVDKVTGLSFGLRRKEPRA